MEFVKKIDCFCRVSVYGVSSVVLMVGYWVFYWICRGKGGCSCVYKFYVVNFLKCYLSVLFGVFSGLVLSVDLMIMFEEEVIEFCVKMFFWYMEK